MVDEEPVEERTEPEEPVGDAPAPKKKARRFKIEKKLIRRRMPKKTTLSTLHAALRLAVETGKVQFGTRSAVKNTLLGNARVLVLAANAPISTREQIQRYSALSSIPLIEFDGSSLELGSVCGKPYPVSLLSVYEMGSSNLMELARASETKKGSHARTHG